MAYIIETASTGISQADAEVLLAQYQDVLVSGTNIKTVNGYTLLGAGNLQISGSGSASFNVSGVTLNVSASVVSETLII